jgi:hypothetical protein
MEVLLAVVMALLVPEKPVVVCLHALNTIWQQEVSQMRDITWVAILMVVAYFAGRAMAYLIRSLP